MQERILSEVNSKPKWMKNVNLVCSILLVILVLITMYNYSQYVVEHRAVLVLSSENQHKVLATQLLEKTVKTFFILTTYVGIYIAIGFNQIINIFLN